MSIQPKPLSFFSHCQYSHTTTQTPRWHKAEPTSPSKQSYSSSCPKKSGPTIDKPQEPLDWLPSTKLTPRPFKASVLTPTNNNIIKTELCRFRLIAEPRKSEVPGHTSGLFQWAAVLLQQRHWQTDFGRWQTSRAQRWNICHIRQWGCNL